MSLLVARGLTVEARREGEAAPVLRGLNFAVAPGLALGLVGEAGSGAAMVGRAVAGLMPAGHAVTHGALEFGGADLVAMAAEERRGLLGREIGFLRPGAAALDPGRRVGALLDGHHRRLGVRGGGALRDYARAALAAVGLADAAILERFAEGLSAVERQLVLVAMAFAGRPRLVVAEEPGAGLDPAARGRVVAVLQALRRAHGVAMLLMTRDPRLAAATCDEVAVMVSGDIVETGPAALVLRAPRHPYTKCLALALPAMAGARQALFLLPEPEPVEARAAGLTQGCRFARRCPVRAEYCLRSEPPLEGGEHRSACLRPGLVPSIAVAEALPSVPWRPAGEVPVLEMAGVAAAGPGEGVRELSLRVAPGEFVAVVGEEGSGKALLGRLAAGLARAESGRVLLAGTDVSAGDAAARRHVAATVQRVFHDPATGLNPRRRVSDIVTQALSAAGARERERRARALLAEMGLPLAFGVRRPGQLSVAEVQMVALARALCGGPRLVVAEGIVAGLDVPVQARLMTLLHRLRRDHDFALLLVSDDLAVVRQLCDRVVVMAAGRIVEEGPAATVLGWPRHERTRALLAGGEG